jgi:UDP-N-acetylmuramoyl-L-alanyl-D-glutamate--2,6-diaminopimelate ligase
MICAADFPHRAAGDALLDNLAQLGVPLADLTADSRAVKRGSVFVAYPGTALDGRKFIPDAIARGATAVLWEREGFSWDERWNVPNLGIAGLRARVSDIAGHVYGQPSRSMWIAGVTGTNGKTSVSQWIAAATDALGCRSAVVGTIGNGLVGEVSEGKNTTPDPIVLQRLLAEYHRRGARCAAMEVSSHGLDQGRTAGITFGVGIFTNLTRDHLDYHRTMEAYAEAKYRLFCARGLAHAVVNLDDEWGRKFAQRLRTGSLDVITYGLESRHFPRIHGSNVRFTGDGVEFDVASEWGRAHVRAGVLGAFNVANLLAVLGALIAHGTPFHDAVRSLGALAPVTGRLERVPVAGAPLVVVDYAHTPDALEKALQALRPSVAAGARLICVFGCGGDRDPGKRPIMGEVAARLADHVVVTSDNPRSEDPATIIEQVLSGITRDDVEAIEDRQVAIFSAVHRARPGDVVLVAGKGHETYQEIAGVRHPFSDREVARAALAQWKDAS